MTHWFHDPSYHGRYYGFHRGLQIALQDGPADYYWFVVNDVSFPEGQDVLTELVGAMQEDPKMGLIGPGEPEADDYEGCHPKPGRRWHKVATVHGLAHLIRGEVIETIGYMNPAFRYSQGAGAEYAYKIYKAGWFLAYSDVATLIHEGSSTYGVVTKISRHEYHRRARKFATRYLERYYGKNWDEKFSDVLPTDVDTNMFAKQKEIWNRKLHRNWKDVCPWFWSVGSRVKGIFKKQQRS
jgi:GT2 family glycosyltransferase